MRDNILNQKSGIKKLKEEIERGDEKKISKGKGGPDEDGLEGGEDEKAGSFKKKKSKKQKKGKDMEPLV